MWHFRTLSVSLGFIDIYRGIPLDKDHARCQRSVRNLTRDQKQINQMKKALRFLSIRSPNPKFLATKSYRTWHNFHVKLYYAYTFQHRNINTDSCSKTCIWIWSKPKVIFLCSKPLNGYIDVGDRCWRWNVLVINIEIPTNVTNIKLPNRFVTSSKILHHLRSMSENVKKSE